MSRLTPINYQISYDAYKEFVDAQGVTQVRIIRIMMVILMIMMIMVILTMVMKKREEN